MDYNVRYEVDEVIDGLHASDTGATWGVTIEEALRKAFEAGWATARDLIADEIERVVGGYPGNEEQRPKIEVGRFMNDAQWAAKIAREFGEDIEPRKLYLP